MKIGLLSDLYILNLFKWGDLGMKIGFIILGDYFIMKKGENHVKIQVNKFNLNFNLFIYY